jgi:hypothetical protein
VTVVDSVLDDLTIQAAGSVGLRNVTADEELLVRADGDVYVFNSRFSDESEIILGPADNDLVIGKSVFEDLDADGGRGENTFDDRGGNKFGELELRRFED